MYIKVFVIQMEWILSQPSSMFVSLEIKQKNAAQV